MGSIRTGEENSGHIDGCYADRGVVGRGGQRSLILWRVLSALLLLTMGGIHLYLVLTGSAVCSACCCAQCDRRGRPGDRDDRRAAPVPPIASVLGCCSSRARCSRWCSP